MVLRGAVCSVALVLFAGMRVAAADAPRSNVVLIMLDDFGYECVGANGGTSYETPHLDRLAATGMRGTRCYVQPLCTPTRVQLMTGQYNVRNYTRFGHLDEGQTTFAHLFQRAGYRTGIAGKWQLGRDMKLPAHFGFERYGLWQLDRRPLRYANPGLEIDGEHIDYANGEYGPDVIHDYACRFIEENRGRPFLLYYPMMLTHSPFQPTPDSPDWDRTQRGERQSDERYFADMVRYADKLIGQLVETLERTGLRERTLVMVLGDNGTGRSVTSRMGAREVRGGKGSAKERGMHVPLVANWPGTIPAGTVVDELVDSTDFLPTLCEAAGIEAPAELVLDGRSFLPLARGEPGRPREWIYCWYARDGGSRSEAEAEFAMDKRYKLDARGELYDLQEDPNEQAPLAGDELTLDAKAAREALGAVLARYRDVRPESIAAQAGPKRRGGAE